MKRTVDTNFYYFLQNNSGGSFHRDDKAGIGEGVIVEALSAADANQRAEKIGLYFDGMDDCSCCGNRWSSQYDDSDGEEVPSVYSTPVTKAKAGIFRKDVFIHYLDGRIECVKLQEAK